MSTEFKQEVRYIVFKLSDVEEHFTPDERQQLARLAEVQRVGRSEAGKPPLEGVVVEKDWPEYEPTWQAIEARVTGAQPAPSVPDGWLQHAARMAALARKLREPDWHLESIREMQRELCALEEAALAAAPEAKP